MKEGELSFPSLRVTGMSVWSCSGSTLDIASSIFCLEPNVAFDSSWICLIRVR